MKKFFLFALAAMAMMSCADDSNTQGTGGDSKSEPSTKVYIQGKEQKMATRAAAQAAIQTADAYYYIRIGSDIPGLGELGTSPSKEYWPQTWNGGTLFDNANKGTVNIDYPYWSQGTTPIAEYVFDTTGEAVNRTLVATPDLKTILNANKNTKYSTTLAKMAQEKDIKVIWYVAKKSSGIWHVDGVLTKTSTKDVTEVIPGIKDEEDVKDFDNKADDVKYGTGNIEVDIHQQEHSSWDEIKTSIHVRDLVNSVTVEIPLEQAHVAESDDFAIRTYDYELQSKVYINGSEYSLSDANPIKVTVEHKADKVVITISAISKDYINALMKEYGDGVTVEVHTYAKGLSKQEVWTRLKKSQVKVNPATYEETGKVIKHITSAFFTE